MSLCIYLMVQVINKYIERLDLNQTLQGKYGGTLQDKDKPETSVASKKRKRLEVKEAKLRTKVNKSASSYTALIAQEIQSRVHFLEVDILIIPLQCNCSYVRMLPWQPIAWYS